MSGLFMDFLQGVGNVAEGVARLPVQTAENFSNTFANVGNKLGGGKNQTIQQNMGGNSVTNSALKFSQATGTNRQLGGDIAQVGLQAAAPEIGGVVGKAVEPLADSLGTVAGGAVKGAAEGVAINAPLNTAQQVGNGQKVSGKNLSMDFLQGAKQGAEFGGAVGGVAGTVKSIKESGLPQNQVGGLNNPSEQFSPKDLNDLAESDDTKAIQKKLEPVTGPIVAQKIAPAIAKTNDPNVAGNIVDNALNQHLAPAAPVAPDTTTPSPPPTPLPPQTSVSDVNTPQQVAGQASSAEASYTPPNTSLSNQDILSEFSKNRSTYGDDDKFYNEFVTQAADMPNKAGDLAAEIIGQVENDNIPVKDALDNSINPDIPRTPMDDYHDARSELVRIASTNKQPQLLTQFDEQTKGMSVEDKTNTLNEALRNYRDKGGMMAERVGNPTPLSETQPPQSTPEEQSLFASAPQQTPREELAFMNAPGESNPTPGLSKLGAVTGMHDILNQGGTVDEALNHYMETTGQGYGEAQDQLNGLMKQSGSEGSLQKGNINASLNPEFDNASKVIPEVQKGDTEQPIKNAQAIHNEVVRRANTADSEIGQLSPNDLKLMDSLRGNTPQDLVGQAEDKPQFLKAANSVKSYNDFTQGVGSGALGQDVAYRQNYGAPLLFDNTPEGQENLEAVQAKLKTTPGYGKGRFVQNYDEGAQFGLQRRNENFRQDLAEDANRRSNDLSQLALAKGLNEALPGQVKVGQIGSTPDGQYRQLLIPGGSKLSLPADVADKINARAPAPDAKGIIGGYDRLNGNWKNLKLAGGGFHSVNVLGSFVGHQLVSGNFIKDPGAISGLVKATLSNKSFQSDIDKWGNSGRLLDMDAAGLQHNALDSQADITPSGKLGAIPGLKQIHQAIFGRQIPYMKMKIFDQETQGLDRNNPEDLAKMTSVAKELNQNFGGINRSIQGLTPKQFKVLSRVFLATDYNEGQIHSLADAFTKGGPAGKLARQVVFGKALLFAGLATAGGAVGGEFKGQTPKQTALDIIQKVINPKFKIGGYTVGLPTTQLSELGKPIAETVGNAISGKSLTNPTKDFLSARLASIPSGVEQLATNRNFSGNPIHGTDYYGRPISVGETLSNVLGGISPIPVAQGIQTGTGQQNLAAGIANTVGVRAAPTNSLEYSPIAAQTYLSELKKTPGVSKEQLNADTNFVEALGAGDAGRSKTINAAEKALIAKQPNKASQIIAKYNQQLVKALAPWAQSKDAQYFDANMLQLLRNTMITYKNANSNVRYDVKTNPTAYGAPIQALTSAPQMIKA